MLTATYTLVALSVEQASVRLSVLSFQQYVRTTLMQQNRITLGQLEYACDTLTRLYQACHWRKIDMYLIPAIRKATERADRLLDELNRLNQAALGVIRSLQDQLGTLAEVRDDQVAQTCASIEAFCAALLQRLEKEERELFAIARRVICGEAWFSIANQLMMHDARLVETRRASVSGTAPAAGAAQHGTPAVGADKGARLSSGAGGHATVPPGAEPDLAPPALQVLPVIDVGPVRRPAGTDAPNDAVLPFSCGGIAVK
jgi:hemerythrin-like domain-containing protein